VGLLTLLAVFITGFGRFGPRLRPRLRIAAALLAFVLLGLAVGCENYVNPINITPYVNGTPAGTYSIVLTGTLGTGSGVTRATTVTLSVLPNG
jgi:hypothetical protein